jgi:putative hydrolase of the HAD superfamily
VAGGAAVSQIEAVVFDLFGTLVHEFPAAEFHEAVRSVGATLGLDPDAFREGWEATSIGRQTGEFLDVEENVRMICLAFGVVPDEETMAEALAHRWALYETYFHPRPGARETLAGVADRGLPMALVSMCAPDTPELWRASPVSAFVGVEVFSCEVGLRKPDPEIYLLASERLGVPAPACLYVGDGAYGEMSGAAAVGMMPVLIRDPDEDPADVLRPEAEEWDGAAIADLREVLVLLDAAD